MNDTMHSRQGLPPASPSSGHWLSFDVHGRIVFCTQLLAEVCGREAAEIRDAVIGTLLPQLATDGKTARQYVASMMGLVDGCHPLHLALADGRTLPVDASVTSMLIGSGPVFVVDLRPAGGAAWR